MSDTELRDATSQMLEEAYEDYAKVYRKLHRAGFNRRPTYEEFICNCPVFVMLPSMPDDVWHPGYEFIADLFDDNE